MIGAALTLGGLAQAIIVTGAVVTALFVLARSVRSTYRFVRRLDLIHTTILQELLPNGGSSLKDQISRIDRRITRLEQVVIGAVSTDDV